MVGNESRRQMRLIKNLPAMPTIETFPLGWVKLLVVLCIESDRTRPLIWKDQAGHRASSGIEERWTGAGRPVRGPVRGGTGPSWGRDCEFGEEQRCKVQRRAVVSTA